jgi:hypothetical protein
LGVERGGSEKKKEEQIPFVVAATSQLVIPSRADDEGPPE